MSVKNAQVALKRLGFAPGPLDNIYGHRSRDAVMRFQRANRLLASGVLDEATWSAIVAQLLSTIDPPAQ